VKKNKLQFFTYNKFKFLRIAGLAYVLCLLAVTVAYLQSGPNRNMSMVILGPIIVSAIATTLSILIGLWKFRAASSLVKENSDTSLLPLFDNGYSILLTNTDSRFFFTGERLRASISGLPVSIDFSKEFSTKRQTIVFSFYPLINLQTGEKAIQTKSYYTGIRHVLFKNIKPDVLQYVEKLKIEGFVAAE